MTSGLEEAQDFYNKVNWIVNMGLGSKDTVEYYLRKNNGDTELTIAEISNEAKLNKLTTKSVEFIQYLIDCYIYGRISCDTKEQELFERYKQVIFGYLSSLAFSRMNYIDRILQIFKKFNLDLSTVTIFNSIEEEMASLINETKDIDIIDDSFKLSFITAQFSYFNDFNLLEFVQILIKDNLEAFKVLEQTKSFSTAKIKYFNILDSHKYSISLLELIIMLEAEKIFEYFVEKYTTTRNALSLGAISKNDKISKLSLEKLNNQGLKPRIHPYFNIFLLSNRNIELENLKIETWIENICLLRDYVAFNSSTKSFKQKNRPSFINFSTKHGCPLILESVINRDDIIRAENMFNLNFTKEKSYKQIPEIRNIYMIHVGKDINPPTIIPKFPLPIEIHEKKLKTKENGMNHQILNNEKNKFSFDEIIEFLKILPRKFKLIENRCDYKEYKYYGRIGFDNQIIFRIRSLDFQNFEIFMINTCSDIGIHNNELCFEEPDAVIYKSNLDSKFLNKTFVHAYVKNYIRKDQFTKYHKDIFKKSLNCIDSIFEALPGYKEFKVASDQKAEGFNLIYKNKKIEWALWIPSTTKHIMSLQDHKLVIQLDATFDFDSYVVIVPHAVIHNNGFPIGLLVAPSESKASYNLIYQRLKNEDQNNALNDAVWMGDFGKGISGFFKDNDLKVWRCLRHFLGRINAKSPAYIVIRDILWSPDMTTYNELYKKINPIIVELHSLEGFTDAQFCAWKELKDKRNELALCLRSPRISTTNHVESFHSKLKKLYQEHQARNVNEKFKLIVIYMMRRINKLVIPNNRSAYECLLKMKKYARSNQIEQVESCNRCKGTRDVLENLYGCEMPCIHTCVKLNKSDIKAPESITIQRIGLGSKINESKNIQESKISLCKGHDECDQQDQNVYPAFDQLNLYDPKSSLDYKYEIVRLFNRFFGIKSFPTAGFIMNRLGLATGENYSNEDREALLHQYIIEWTLDFHEFKKKVEKEKAFCLRNEN